MSWSLHYLPGLLFFPLRGSAFVIHDKPCTWSCARPRQTPGNTDLSLLSSGSMVPSSAPLRPCVLLHSHRSRVQTSSSQIAGEPTPTVECSAQRRPASRQHDPTRTLKSTTSPRSQSPCFDTQPQTVWFERVAINFEFGPKLSFHPLLE